MNTTRFWARLLGMYLMIVSAGMLYDLPHFYSVLEQFTNNPSSLMTAGFFTLLFGLAIVNSHSIYKGWPIVVTLLGYLTVIKGFMLIFHPETFQTLLPLFLKNTNSMILIGPFMLGALIVFIGKKKA